jgi:TRAP-type mannitol/chloroaromatic compound transport system permease small subunit
MRYIILTLKVIDRVSEAVGKAASCFILLIAVIQLREVVMRYFFSKATVWGWEVATYLYGANFILAAPWALMNGRHVRTDFLFARLSRKWQAVLDLCTFSTIFLLFCGVLVYFTVKAAFASTLIFEVSYAFGDIPIWPLRVVIATGFTLLLLQGLAKVVRDIIFLVKGEAV